MKKDSDLHAVAHGDSQRESFCDGTGARRSDGEESERGGTGSHAGNLRQDSEHKGNNGNAADADGNSCSGRSPTRAFLDNFAI